MQRVERARGLLAAFGSELSGCFGAYRDTLFEVCDAVLCKQDQVHMAAELSLEPECRRGHGAVYKALNRGRVQVARLRWALAALPLPAGDDGRIRLAVDVSNWLRPDAAAGPEAVLPLLARREALLSRMVVRDRHRNADGCRAGSGRWPCIWRRARLCAGGQL